MPGPPDEPWWIGEWCIIEAPAEKHTLFKETELCSTTAFREKFLFRQPKGFQFGLLSRGTFPGALEGWLFIYCFSNVTMLIQQQVDFLSRVTFLAFILLKSFMLSVHLANHFHFSKMIMEENFILLSQVPVSKLKGILYCSPGRNQ